jgi:hypothetical protein
MQCDVAEFANEPESRIATMVSKATKQLEKPAGRWHCTYFHAECNAGARVVGLPMVRMSQKGADGNSADVGLYRGVSAWRSTPLLCCGCGSCEHGGETGRGEWPSLPGDVGGSEGARGEERRAAVKQKGAVKYVKSLPGAIQE